MFNHRNSNLYAKLLAALDPKENFVSLIKITLSAAFYTCNTTLTMLCMLPFILLKLLPIVALRIGCTKILNILAQSWCGRNSWWIGVNNPIQWTIDIPNNLAINGWYVVVCNHQSWVDIVVLQKIFHHKIPFLKFFIKRELIYIPLLGLAWWALDFPFLRRRGRATARQDLQTARQACEKFRHIPTSVISFVEGTRFTAEKHHAQASLYQHLLNPKSGGLGVALETMGTLFTAALDVTIVYPKGVPSFANLMAGHVTEVHVHAQLIPIPRDCLPQKDGTITRANVQNWLNGLWQAKDTRITQMHPKA